MSLRNSRLAFAYEANSKLNIAGIGVGGRGDLLVGSKGSIYSDNPWNARYALLPEKRFEDFTGGPPESLPRVKSHQWEWIEACKGNGKTFSSFDIGGPLTELAQLANLATRVAGPIE